MRTEDRTSDAGTDAELTVTVNASLDSDRPATEKESEAESESESRPRPICNVAIELSSYATLDDVQVCVDVSRPLLVTDDFYSLPSLCKPISRDAPRSNVYKRRTIFRRATRGQDSSVPGRRLASLLAGRLGDSDLSNGRGCSESGAKDHPAASEDRAEKLPSREHGLLRHRGQERRSTPRLQSPLSR